MALRDEELRTLLALYDEGLRERLRLREGKAALRGGAVRKRERGLAVSGSRRRRGGVLLQPEGAAHVGAKRMRVAHVRLSPSTCGVRTIAEHARTPKSTARPVLRLGGLVFDLSGGGERTRGSAIMALCGPVTHVWRSVAGRKDGCPAVLG